MKRVLPAVLLLVTLGGCVGPVRPTVAPPSQVQETRIVVDLGEGITLTLVGTDEATAPADQACVRTTHRLNTASGRYQAALVKPGCDNTQRPGNGFHGYFTAPPEGVAVESAETPVGPAEVFDSEYYECTNSCATGVDQVALVPVGTQILQVIAETSPSGSRKTRDRADLVALLQGLRKS
jgi:hypothetical protein